MINKKETVNETREILLKEVKKIFANQAHVKFANTNLAEVFENSINNTINKTAHDINYDIINYGEFTGWRK